MKKSTNASTEAQLITPATLTDEQRGLIERAEDRLCGRGAEDADAANGLLEVLIAHPARPIAHDEAAHPEKSCADALTGIAQFLTDVVTAAGLLSHGRTDKKLATRITEQADELRTHMHLLAASPAEKPAAAPILKAPEGEDPMRFGDRSLESSIKRLTAAYCVQQPSPIPDQMALVWRFDIGRLRNDWIRLNAWQKSEHAPAPADERADALYDSAYCAGLQAGFRFGDAGDNDGLRKALESRAGYIEVLRSARASSANETADGWAVFDAWFADAWARYEDKEVVSQIRAKTWALKAWRYLMARTTSTKEWEALIAERDAAILSTHRQAFCIEQCAAHIGPETPATINGLPLAVKRVVEERDAARASANETEAAGATAEAATLLRQARDELCLVEWENDPPNRVQTLFDRIEAYVSRTPAQAAEPVAIEQVIHQVWVEATSSWADVTPAYYAERQPSNRRRVYYAPQRAQADARNEDAYVAKRLSEALADVYTTLIGDDKVDADDKLNAIERVERAAQVLRLEVELYRAQAEAQKATPACTCPSGDGSLRWPCPAHSAQQVPNTGALTDEQRHTIATFLESDVLSVDEDAVLREILAAHPGQPAPIDMLLFCPKCGEQHIDAPEEREYDAGLSTRMEVRWTNPIHRSHLCHACETIWRPADVPTNGVAAIQTRGKADTWNGQPEQRSALLYEHDDGRYAVAPSAEEAHFTRDDPAWHRVGLVTVYGPHPEPRAEVTAAARDVLAERQRQVEREGWTSEHDAQHTDGEMARAAGCYALHAGGHFRASYPHVWPWNQHWWKPTAPRRDLVKAGALILAEIERLDRSAAREGGRHAE